MTALGVGQLTLGGVTDESSGAIFSECGLFRYRLWRRWGKGEHVLWVLANPSTADAYQDDPTMRRCQSFARRWGYDAIEVGNIFGFRSTDPHGLDDVPDRIGPENDTHLLQMAARASLVIAAWGVGTGAPWFAERAARVREMLGARLYCLGTTASGSPRHPLYLSSALEPEPLR